MNPGLKCKPFYIQFNEDYFKGNDILETPTYKVKVLKVYRNTWWRRFLRRLGFKVRTFTCKVISNEQ